MIPQPMFSILTVVGALTFLAAGYLAARLRAAGALAGAGGRQGELDAGLVAELELARQSAHEAAELRQQAELELEQLRGHLLAAEQEAEAARAELDELEQDRSAVVARVTRLSTNLELVASERDSLRQASETTAMGPPPKALERLQQAEQQSRHLRATVESLEIDQMAAMKYADQARLELESVQGDRAMLVTRARNQETLITKLEREKRELQRRQSWLDQQNNDLQQEQGAMLAELGRLEVERQQGGGQQGLVVEELRQAREELQQLAEARAAGETEAAARARELAEARAALLETEQEASELARDLERLQALADQAPQDPAKTIQEAETREVEPIQDPGQTVDLGPVSLSAETREVEPAQDSELVLRMQALITDLGRVQTARGAVVVDRDGQLVARDSDDAEGLAAAGAALSEAGARVRELLPLAELRQVAVVDQETLTVTALPLDGDPEPLVLATLSRGPGPTSKVVNKLLKR